MGEGGLRGRQILKYNRNNKSYLSLRPEGPREVAMIITGGRGVTTSQVCWANNNIKVFITNISLTEKYFLSSLPEYGFTFTFELLNMLERLFKF